MRHPLAPGPSPEGEEGRAVGVPRKGRHAHPPPGGRHHEVASRMRRRESMAPGARNQTTNEKRRAVIECTMTIQRRKFKPAVFVRSDYDGIVLPAGANAGEAMAAVSLWVMQPDYPNVTRPIAERRYLLATIADSRTGLRGGSCITSPMLGYKKRSAVRSWTATYRSYGTGSLPDRDR
jgi:hypothetical protein